jgi:DNA-binding CsgD family transcriptional regulator
MLSIALYLLIALGGVITLFGSHIAEQILKQRSILAIAYAITFIAVYILWKRIGIDPFKIGSILASIGTLGFMGMVLSIYIPSLATISIIFIGVGTATFAINVTYGGIVLMRRYPSRFTVPIMVIIAFTLVLIHALLLNALQDNLPFLYAIYLFFSIVLTILYLMLYPYLSYTMHEKTRTEPIIPSEKTESLNEHSFDKLSGQELRLAELIMQGYTNSEMAEVLNITENTVKGYRKTLYSKLQIHSRKELFALAER